MKSTTPIYLVMSFAGMTFAAPGLAQNNDAEAVKPADEAPPTTLDQVRAPVDDDSSIKVIVQKHQTIEEYRERGELVLVKVIPNDGLPYFIDPLEREKLKGSGRDLINSGVKPVRWVLKEF